MKETLVWLLNGSEATATIFDKCMLFIVKIIYLGIRIFLRIILGKERRDLLYIKHNLDFASFWYKSYNIWKQNNGPFLKLNMPKYNFEFYCRNNKDDFKAMIIHKDDIIEHFRPKEGDIVVDVGAHIGLYTMIASRLVGENGKVIAIEAHPENYEMLNRNIKLNGLTNVMPLNYAVYSKETKIKLYLRDEELGCTVYNTIIGSRANTREDKSIEVNANTLDDLLQNNGISHADINWIKIDVEGAEFEVLKGAVKVLAKNKNIALLIEVHNLEDGKNLYRPIMDLLEKYNFKVEFENTYYNGEKHIILRNKLLI